MRKSSKPYLILFACLLVCMGIPFATSEWLREKTLSIFSPVYTLFTSDEAPSSGFPLITEDEPQGEEPSVPSIPAKIIFRSPNTWNSSMWVNVGSEDNELLAIPIIAKNSPVLLGDSVVGVVDYVGKRQSRIRLITDSGLVPSVRVSRGEDQYKFISEQIADLMSFSNAHPELFETITDKKALENQLAHLQAKLLEKKNSWFLAKGEIQGRSYPLWRKDAYLLKGSGFNYDFEDKYGPARDLRSGEAVDGQKDDKGIPLVKVHDLLVTTGMDGVFPEGLKVATVTKIELLKEGDFAYELEAKPTVGNFDDLSWVYIISPLGYDENDQAPIK